jgi:branched-chain amino acid transport system ATP-binding protein
VTSTSLLHLRDVSAGYGGVPVVQHLDIEVKAGEIVTLLGANGAGKTTILHTIAGVLRPISGEVHSSGSRLTGALHTRAKGGLALVTEERAVIHQLSVIDNLRLGTRQVDEAFRLFPNLKLIQHRRAGLLSGGEQQMLVLARVLSNKARLLLVDELSFGLAPLIVQSLLGTLREAADSGCGVLLVEQHPSLALSVADRGYVIGKGKVQLEGSSSDLLAQLNEIEATYLSA